MPEQPQAGIRVPREVLWGAFGLIAFTFSAIVVARDTGIGTLRVPPLDETAGRELVFRALPDNGMEVTGTRGARVAVLEVQGDSFAMAAVRGLAAQRDGDLVSSGYRLRLRRGAGGVLELADPDTGRALSLVGFGPDNLRDLSTWLETAR